jgi:hypothetical protein
LADRVVTGAINVINNISLQDVLAKETKYSEPKFIYWKHTFEILMYSAEEHARQWTKREKEDIYIISGWVQRVRSLKSFMVHDQ